MATLTELNAILGSPGDLQPKIIGALLIEAAIIVALGVLATDKQKIFAKTCFELPNTFYAAALGAILGMNHSASSSDIVNADDAAVQNAVHNIIPVLVG